MANKEQLRIAVVENGMKQHCNAVLNAIDEAEKYGAQLTDAQDGGTTLAWSRTLYGVADTGSVTLTVDATTDSSNPTISCVTGANLFANFRVGRDVQITSFPTAGNNQTTEVTAQTNDSITLGGATGMVDETDSTARVQENTTSDEQAVVTDIIDTRTRFTELKNALDNVAVATADRRDDLNDFIW